jgi:hypothetical protein
MEHGANPTVKNDLGRDVLSYCDAFPEIRGAIKRVQMEARQIKNEDKKSSKLITKSGVVVSRVKSTAPSEMLTEISSKSFTLQRRLSTATSSKYDMYLLNLSTMLDLFGSEASRKANLYTCHQDLLKTGKLTRFEDLPMGSFVMFISHQWNGFAHPDPNGRKMEVLSKVLRDLRDGCYKTETNAFHVLVYKQNTITTSSEWKELLSNAYVWYDWISQPQPSQGTSLEEVKRLERDLVSALDSVASYVERSDTLVILSPSCVHADKINEQTHRKTYVEWTHFFFFYSPCFYTSYSLSHSPNQVHVLSNVEKTRLLRHGVLLQELISKSYASGTSCSIGV